MVFESLVVNLVNTYLGKYVKDLDSSNLDLGIWRGDVVLNNLTLKENALDELDLPVEVTSGYIGKLSAEIPWSNIYTKPVVVKIEDVFVLAAPVTEIGYDAKQAEERLKATKRRKLQAIDKSNKPLINESSQESGLPDTYTFLEKLTAQIIKNVQVFIKNIHIRYEDKVTTPGSAFAVGITLNHLTAETTDNDWKPCVVNATEKNIFKFVNLDSLAVYWNADTQFRQYSGSQSWQSLLRSDIKTKAAENDDHEYVLEPFSFEARVKIDQNSAITNNTPKVCVKVQQQDMILSLSKLQFHNLMNLIESFELMIANEPYRKYRPEIPLKSNAKIWWKYAYAAVVNEKIRTWSWENIRRHRSLYHEYKNVYKRKLYYEAKGIENGLTSLKCKIYDIEEKLELSSILIAREHAHAEFIANPIISGSDDVEEPDSGWWEWMFGSNETTTKELPEDFNLSQSLSLSALSPDEKERLYEALDYSENDENTKYPKEYVKYELLFSMENFEVHLMNEVRRNLGFVSMCGVSGSVGHRPSSSNTSFNFEVNDINLYGHNSNLYDDAAPKLLYLQNSELVDDLVFFELLFEINPIHVSADYSVNLKLEALKIVHDTNTVMQFVNFFKMPQSRALKELTEVASSGLVELQNRTRAGLEYAVSQQTIVYFDVNLKSPCVVIPEYGAMDRPGSVFVVDFGHLTIKTDLMSKQSAIQDATESELENMLCDNFDVVLTDMQVLIANKGDDWLAAHAKSNSPFHLLPSSQMNLDILRNTNSAYSLLPEIKMNGVLPQLEIRLSDEKYKQLMQFVSNLPLLTEPLDNDENDDNFLTKYPATLSRHSSRLSLVEVADIQNTTREAFAKSLSRHVEDEFLDAEDCFENDGNDDEDEWVLASENFPETLSKDDQESPNSKGETLASNKVTTCGQFAIGKVSVVFNKLVQAEDQTYICLEVNDLSANVSLTEYVMEIFAKLGSVHLTDYFFKDVNGGPLIVVSSVAEKELISLFYRKIDPECPFFDSTFNGVQLFVKSEFNVLNVLFHREGITTFQNFILDLVERSEKPNFRKLGERVTSYLEVIPEGVPLDTGHLSNSDDESSSVTSGRTSIETTLDEVRATLCADNKNFALLGVNGLHVNAFLEDEKTYIKARLGLFTVEDLSASTLHRKVLTVEDDSLCDFKATFYSKKAKIHPTSVDMDVCCNFGRLKYVFLHKFLVELQEFFTSFASSETRQYAHDATAQAVQIQVEQFQETSQKISFNIRINAPVIKIPLNPLADDGVIVDLGSLFVRNNLEYQQKQSSSDAKNNAKNNAVLTDKINVTLESFNVIRIGSAISWSGIHHLVDPTGLDISVTRCLEDSCAQMPGTDIEILLRQLTTSVDESDFRLLMRIWTENIQHTSLEETDGRFSTEEISHMPEVEQHLIEDFDGPAKSPKSIHENSLKLTAIVDYVSLQFPCSINNKRLPRLELTVQKLESTMCFSERTNFGSARLGDLSLFDYNSIGSLMKPLAVLESSREKDLISVQYRQEMYQESSKATHAVDILSTIIKVHFEEQSVLRIQELCKSFMDSLSAVNSPTSFTSSSEADKNETESPKIQSNESGDNETNTSDDVKLTVNLNRLEVMLSRKETPIVRAVIEDVFTQVTIGSETFALISRQKGLSITDLNPLSNYVNVVTIEGDKLFDFEYRSLPSTLPSSANHKTTPHGQLALDIGKIRFVFLYKLLSDIQLFLQTLVSPETTSYSYELAQKTVQEQLETIEVQGTRISLKLSIQAPIVILPSHSQSTNCLIADLGHLKAENIFTVRNQTDQISQEVVVDTIDVALQSLQLSRGTLDLSSGTFIRRLLVRPLKMTLVLSRSMDASAHWLPYLEMKMALEHVVMNMDETDYQLLVSALQQNYAEADIISTSPSGLGLSGDVFLSELPKPDDIDNRDSSSEPPVKANDQAEDSEVWDTTVITFTFSGLSLMLYNDEAKTNLTNDSPHHKEKTLCNCELQESNGTLTIRSDSSIGLHLNLYGCIVEDARENKVTAFPRMLSHRTEQKLGKKRSSRIIKTKRQSMIEVSYEQAPSGEMHVNLVLQDPVLYISFPLLWSLLDFFSPSSNLEGSTMSQSTMDNHPSSQSAPYVLVLSGALKNPEIILLGEPDSPNSSALIVQTSIDFEYKLVDDQQNFSATSKDLIVHTCRYPDREKTLYKVVKPCAIDFRYSYPGSDCEGQEIYLGVPEMKIKVSPLLLKTLLTIYESFYGDQEIIENYAPESVLQTDHSEHLCQPQPISKDDYLYQCEAPVRVPSRVHLNTTVTEKFSLEMKSVRLTLYDEVMAHRVPLLLMNCNILLHVKDWSSQLKLVADLSLEAWYYNETFAAWEPFMESEETLSERRLWQLELKVFKADSHVLSFTPGSEEQNRVDKEDFKNLTSSSGVKNSSDCDPSFNEDQKAVEYDEVDFCYVSHSTEGSESKTDVSENIPQATYIVLSSDDIMQLTVTRSALDVLTDISEILANVTSASSSETALPESPFIVVNDLGIHTFVSLSYRHETLQRSTPELTIARRNRVGLVEHENSREDTSKSYPAELYKLDPTHSGFGTPKFSKDDSAIDEEHKEEVSKELGLVMDYPDGPIEMAKTPTLKRITRSISMPAKEMSSKVKLFEEKECKSRPVVVQGKKLREDVHKEYDQKHEGIMVDGSEKKILLHTQVPFSETKLNVHSSEKTDRLTKPEDNKRPKKERRLFLGNIDEEIEDDKQQEEKQLEISDKDEAPSFISGTFARMGLFAAISGHPVAGAEKIMGKPENEKKEVLFERPEYKKSDDYISIKVDEFEELSFVPVTRAGRFLYKLCPKKNDRYYYIVVQIEIKHGQKRVTIRAPLQVKNNMNVAVDLIQSGAARLRTNERNECRKDRRISTIQAKDVGNLPLFYAHEGNFFIRPSIDGFKKSTSSVSWRDFSEKYRTSILTCLPVEAGPNYAFCAKVHCDKDLLNTVPSNMAPHHILHLHPTITFGNFLPFSVTLKLEDADIDTMVIEPGKRHQLTCVTTNKESKISLTVEEYMGSSWSAIFKLGGDGPREDLVEMNAAGAVPNKLYIRLEYVEKGGLIVNFYSSYWIVNKTNLSILYKSTKSSSDTYKQLASDIEPLLYEPPLRAKKIMLKLHLCDWSNSFSLDAVGNAGELVCEETKTSREYKVAITIELSRNTLTKIITIMPKFVIINKTQHVLSMCETQQKDHLWIIVKPNQCVPFWPMTKSNSFLVKLVESMLTSKVLRMDSLFPSIFRVGHGLLLEMSTEITESSTTIVFTHASVSQLPRMVNLCDDISIKLHQKDAGATTILSPLTSILYLWDEPGGDLTLLWQPENYHVQPTSLSLNKDGIGQAKLHTRRRLSHSMARTIGCMGGRSSRRPTEPVTRNEMGHGHRRRTKSDSSKIKSDCSGIGEVLYWVSFLDGFQRNVVFTYEQKLAREIYKHCSGEPVTTEIFLSLDGVRLSVMNQKQSEIVYVGISSSTSIWEVKDKSKDKWKILDVETSSLLEEAWRNNIRPAKGVEVDFDNMVLIKPYAGNLNRKWEPGLWIHYSSSVNYESFSAKLQRVQIDNQIFGTIFPCALYPSPLPTYITQRYGFKPFFEASATYRSDSTHNFLHLRYFKILIQEMNIKLEREFLQAIYNLFYCDYADEQDEGMLFQQHLQNISLTLEDTLVKSGSLDTHRLFLEEFHLSPLKVNLSLSLRSSLYQSENQSDSDLFQVLVDSVGSPLTEVNDVLIKLACFERSGRFTTKSSLVSSARKHYTWQALRQFHAIAFGLDVLGNPYGLLTDIGEGVKDFFYEPCQGIVLGPEEFATGLARGVKSLLGHAVGGTAGAMSKITGTFGQAFASLSFDQDYRMKRRLRMASGPSNIQEGVAMGGKSFLMGVVFGISGVVTKPYQGARADGVEGFFKGFGKGILGLVTRPTVGVFDMVSTTLDGIRRSAEQDGEDVVVRMRMPRFSPPDAPLRPYVDYQANGNAILKSLPRTNEIIHDVYIDHIPLPKDSDHSSISIFTNMRFLLVHQSTFWSEWKINVDIPYEDISGNVRLSQGAMLISTKNNDTIEIESTDQTTLQVVHKKLEEQLYHYRATK